MALTESVGYEGRTIEELVADLVVRRVEVLVDVRLTAVSRKRGFNKTALRKALLADGIEYLHAKSLGNPKDNRAPFGGADVESGRAHYRALLTAPQAQVTLQELADLAEHKHLAVMCFERNEQRCHRQMVIDELRCIHSDWPSP